MRVTFYLWNELRNRCQQMYIRFLPDLISQIHGYGNWGHQQMLNPNKLWETGKSCYQTKTNLINLNSMLINQPIEES